VALKDIVKMSKKELKRLHLVNKAIAREVRQVEIAEVLGISDRQVRRLVKRVGEEGDEGIIHGLQGEESNRKYGEGCIMECPFTGVGKCEKNKLPEVARAAHNLSIVTGDNSHGALCHKHAPHENFPSGRRPRYGYFETSRE